MSTDQVSGRAGQYPPVPLISLPNEKDLWVNRSENMRCIKCMWYVPKGMSAAMGRCRRHAPTMNGYPVVMPGDWCGDHKLDETKI